MLSWSSREAGAPADLGALVAGRGDAGLRFGRELVRFTDAASGSDITTMTRARDRLVDVGGAAFMIDAAAVVAAFEMFTRVVDGTGGRFPPDVDGHRAALDAQLGIGSFTSAR
jgi:hypothetical protein